ncbi:transcriptional regulator [Paenibacillus sp. BIHB 4019]|nr:transcriptional regulator [Paenibacillus sp. BIHB 4019]
MMRMKLLIVTMIFSLLIVGCTQAELNSIPVNAAAEATPSLHETPPINPTESSPPLNLLLEGIQGHIRNVHYADEDHVLISANKLYLYDLDSGRIIAESSDEGIQSIRRVEDGYVAIQVAADFGNNGSRSGGGTSGGVLTYSAIFYDPDLVKQSEFNFSSLLKENERIVSPESIAFSADGKRVAYATNNGLYLYDFNMSQQTTLIDLKQAELTDLKERSGVVAFEQIGFTNGDKDLAFTAQSFDVPPIDGKPSFSTCGTVHLDGSKLTNQKFESYTCRELIDYNEFVFFAEDLDFTIPSGKLLVMNMPSGKTRFLSMIEAGESRFVSGSDRGSYFATTLADQTDWKVRIYDGNTGKLEDEQRISSDGDMRYMAQDPIVKILDERRVYIVLVGAKNPEIQTKVVIGQF